MLYRVWHLEEQFTVSFDTAGGSAVDAQTWKKSSGLLWAALAVLTGSAALAALTEKKKRHGR